MAGGSSSGADREHPLVHLLGGGVFVRKRIPAVQAAWVSTYSKGGGGESQTMVLEQKETIAGQKREIEALRSELSCPKGRTAATAAAAADDEDDDEHRGWLGRGSGRDAGQASSILGA